MSLAVDTGPFCAAASCSETAAVVVEHPDHGRRVVCDEHAADFDEVVEHV